MLENILGKIKKYIPTKVFQKLQPFYHYSLSLLAAIIYRFPSRKIIVVAVTGTKGKTSTTEILNALMEEGGFKTALGSTLRFKIGDKTERNMYKMTTPGRFTMQRFLRNAVNAGCQYAIIEMTSQAVLQYRHKFISLDGLIFTNLSPEHIESHGSYENYVSAKLEIGKALEKSSKKRKILVVNSDDKESPKFLNLNIPEKYQFSLNKSEPYEVKKEGLDFTFEGIKMTSHLSGEFNLYNILGAITYAKSQGVSLDKIKLALEKFKGIRGRVEFIEEGQDFKVVVDYAHTPDSLEKLYDVFQNSKRICVLGNTGGGRDKWKRKTMAEIANSHCSYIVLTNEDPYDENPREIVEDMAKHMEGHNHKIIMDRREAIRNALLHAKTGDVVLISGKGTDPYIMGANGTKIPWDDASVTREELRKIK
jgi:UDP-N-acetylmuramoyl-L-alanyl-D-glutamate--2,6-diaminopimelate ligase